MHPNGCIFFRMGEPKLLAQIEILASLQTVDREIKEQRDRKQELLGELAAKEKEIGVKKREIGALGAAFSEKEKLRLEKDRFFQDEGKKAMDKRMRMNRIKNIKELQALQREIDLMRQANGELEEDLIRIMQEIDIVKAQIQTKEAEMAAMQEGVAHQASRAASANSRHRRSGFRSGHAAAKHRFTGDRRFDFAL